MSLNLIGRFPCTLGRGALNESKNGALMYTVEVLINDAEGNPYPVLMNNFVLVKKDGEIMQRNVDKLIALLGGQWDGSDPAKLEGVDPSGIEAVATCDDREYEGKMYTEVKWLDAAGASGGRELPQQVDAKSIAAKYGSKFRALYGGKATTAAPSKPATAPSAPPVKPAAPPKKSPPPPSAPKAPAQNVTAIANACWSALNAAMTDAAETDITEKWFALIKEHSSGEDQTKVTAEQWTAIGADIAAINNDPTPF